jgi:hypothetical protein
MLDKGKYRDWPRAASSARPSKCGRAVAGSVIFSFVAMICGYVSDAYEVLIAS